MGGRTRFEDVSLRQAVTSFRASDVPAGHLGPILADYLALEQLKIFRRLLVKRIGLITVFSWTGARLSGMFSPLALSAIVAALMAIPTAAWVSELRAEGRLARRLSTVPRLKKS
jgi:hypothetical protein